MTPEKLFPNFDISVEDIEDLTDILNNDLNVACAHFYYVFGMTNVTKSLIHAFYKLRIKICEIGVRRIEALKNSHNEAISHPDAIIDLAKVEAELEIAREDYEYFKLHDKIREE